MKVTTLMYDITEYGYILFSANEEESDFDEVFEANPTVGVGMSRNKLGENIPAFVAIYYGSDLNDAVAKCDELVESLFRLNYEQNINDHLITAFYHITENLDEAIEIANEMKQEL